MATCSDAESDGIPEEIELLREIYVNELEISGPLERPLLVNLLLHPSTGDDDHDSKYVCLNLGLTISEKYPFLSPGISIKNPRGLSDAHVVSIQENLTALAQEKIGSPMLYDLIEYAKECLSDNNIPSCPCVICLEHFEREEKFVKTECYHYFHAVCLANYVDHFLSENEDKTLVCPMCRVEIVYNKSDYNPEEDGSFSEEIFVYKPDEEQLRAQAERQRIFEYQKRKGGIINIEEERNKFLIGIKDRKEDENESNELSQPPQESLRAQIAQATVDFLSRERQVLTPSESQACTLADESERSSGKNKARSKNNGRKSGQNNEKNKSRGSITERPTSKGQACVGEPSMPWRRPGDKKGMTERNDGRPSGSHEKRKESWEQTGDDRNKSKKEEDLNFKRKDEKILKQGKESKDQYVCSSSLDDMTYADKERKGKDFSLSRSHRDPQIKREISSKDQTKEENSRPLDTKDGKTIENDKRHLKLSTPSLTGEVKLSTGSSQIREVKSSASSSKTFKQGRNMESKKEHGSSYTTRPISSNSSKHVTNKQHERKANERNGFQTTAKGGRTSRGPKGGKSSKLVNGNTYAAKSYSSVISGSTRAESAKRKDQNIKRNDVSENNNKFGKRSDTNCPRKADRTSLSVDETVVKNDGSVKEVPLRKPPPGFENFYRTAVQGGHEDPSVRDEPPKRRARPGFENVTPSVKKL